MKKKLIKTTFYILLYSSLAKILSFIVRMLLARRMSTEAMNYYSLSMPTVLLLITLAQMGIPSAMSKLIASHNSYKKTLKASIIFSILNNILLMIIFAFAIPLLVALVFKDDVLIPVLYSCITLIPLITFSGLCKGYLLGVQRMIPYSMSQITEEVFRLLFLYWTLPMATNPVILAKLAIISISIGELASGIHMLIAIAMKNNVSLDFFTTEIDRSIYSQLLMVAVPMTMSRLIGSFCYFLEPIAMLLKVDPIMHQAFINEFSALNSFVQPLITLPSFATVMISNWALPAFSNAFSKNNKKQMKQIFAITCLFSLSISSIWGSILYFFPEQFLYFFYKQTSMAPLLKSLTIPFIFFGLQSIFSVIIHATNQSTKGLIDTTTGCIIRLLCFTFLPPLLGVKSLSISLSLSMLVTTCLHGFHVVRVLFFKNE